MARPPRFFHIDIDPENHPPFDRNAIAGTPNGVADDIDRAPAGLPPLPDNDLAVGDVPLMGPVPVFPAPVVPGQGLPNPPVPNAGSGLALPDDLLSDDESLESDPETPSPSSARSRGSSLSGSRDSRGRGD